MDSAVPSGLSGAEKDELVSQVKQAVAISNAQELLTRVTQKCFQKCITKPGASLDNSDQKCVSLCMDRYMDSWGLVAKAYATRLKHESQY